MLNKFKNDEGGFTLIELLVVILIIGILAAVALPTFLGQAAKGRDATAKSDLRSAATKVEACATDAGAYTNCVGSDTVGTKLTGAIVGNGYSLTAPKGTYSTKHSWKVTSDGSSVGAPTELSD